MYTMETTEHVKAENLFLGVKKVQISSDEASLSSLEATVSTEDATIVADSANISAHTLQQTVMQENNTSISSSVVEQLHVTGGVICHNTYVINDGSLVQDLLVQKAAPEPASDHLETDFLKVMKDHVKTVTKHDVRSAFSNLQNSSERIFPKMMVIQMEDGCSNPRRQSTDNGLRSSNVGADHYEITIEQIHEPYEGRNVDHVMILGETGDGKSITAKRYAELVDRHETGLPAAIQDVELVHFITVSSLYTEDSSEAFDLLFTQQVGSKLTSELRHTGKEWLHKNPQKTLLILDGFDKGMKSFGGHFPKISRRSRATADVILANVLSGHLYPGMKILSTTRWHTFWGLAKEQKSPKTIALRGFDRKDILNLVKSLAGEDGWQQISQRICDKSPELGRICRNPMFLVYVIEALILDPENPPETTSEIMVSVLTYFTGSKHKTACRRRLMETLTTLAFNGTKDNRFLFSASYVESLSLDIAEIRDLIRTSAKLDPFQCGVEKDDLMIRFPQKGIQELLAAVYVCNMSTEDFKRYITVEFRDPKWSVVCRFVYGLMVNPKTTAKAEKYLKDDPCGFEVRKSIVESQLNAFLCDNSVSSSQVLSLLHECGEDMLERYQSTIHQIDVDTPLKAGENYIAASIICKCSSNLKKVRLYTWELSSSSIQMLSENDWGVGDIQVGKLVIGHQTDPGLSEVTAAIVERLQIDILSLQTGDEFAKRFCESLSKDSKVTALDISYNWRLSAEAFPYLAEILGRVGIHELMMKDCSLTEEKLRTFLANSPIGIELNYFDLNRNKDLKPGGYHCLAEIIEKMQVRQLSLCDCNLTEEKLDSLQSNMKGRNIKVDNLYLRENVSMKPGCFKHLAEIFQHANARFLGLENCDLTSEKLALFGQTLKRNNIQIPSFEISRNMEMDPEAFHEMAELVVNAKISKLWMVDCDLNRKKLDSFQKNLRGRNVEMQALMLNENKDIEPEGFQHIVEICQNGGVKDLVLDDCDLSHAKLKVFAEHLEGKNIEISGLSIGCNKEIDAAAFKVVAQITRAAKVEKLWLEDGDLRHGKFAVLHEALQSSKHKTRVQIWYSQA